MAGADERGAVLSSDTTAAAEAVQVRAWRAMAPADIARLVNELSSMTRAIAIAGLRERYPDASDPEPRRPAGRNHAGSGTGAPRLSISRIGAVTGVLDVLGLVVIALDRGYVDDTAAALRLTDLLERARREVSR